MHDAKKSSVQSASAPAPPWYVGTWSGPMIVERHVVKSPARQFAWMKDRGTRFTGDGSLQIAVDEHGVASGVANGPLGTQQLTGRLAMQRIANTEQAPPFELTLHMTTTPRRLDTFSGTMQCRSEASATWRCSFFASSGDGDWVRKGNARLDRKKNGHD